MALEKLTDAWSSSFQARAAGKDMAETWEKTWGNQGICRDYLLILGWKLVKTMLSGCKTLILMHCNWGSSMICPSKLDRTKKEHWKFERKINNYKKCELKNRQRISEQTLTTIFKPGRLLGGLIIGSGNWNPIWAEKIRLHLAIQAEDHPPNRI